MNQQNNEDSTFRSKKYFIYMMFVLMLVLILDNYTQFYSNIIPSKVVEEFLADYPQNVANSIFAICLAIASIGSYIVFFVWYLADRVGRKFLLVLTVLGMTLASIGILFSSNIVEYTIYRLMLVVFCGSDIWLIYINEESPPEKKAFWTNILLVGGMIGIILMPVFRSIYVTETSPVGAWRGMTYFSIILGIPLVIVVALTIKETSKYQEIKESKPSTKEKTNLFKKNLKVIFKSERRMAFIAILILSFLRALTGIFISLGEIYLAQSPYLSEGAVNIVVIVLSLSVVVGFFTTGILADKIGRKPLLFAYCIILFIGAIIFVFGTLTPEFALILASIGMGVINVAYWGSWVLLGIITIELVPTDARGTGSGIKIIIASLGSTLGLIIAGIITYYYSLGVAFIMFALLLLVNPPIIYKYLIETKGTDLSKIIP